MRRKLWLLALVGMVLWNIPMSWADEVYVIAGGRGVGTRINSVPYEIKNPGFYYLGGDLTLSGSTSAITIKSDNVTLDLMGFSLTNTASSYPSCAVVTTTHTNIEVRNGTVSGFYTGVEAWGSSRNIRVFNVRAQNNTYGIYLNGDSHLIKNCSGVGNTHTGIGMDSGLIIDCIATNNVWGIQLFLGPGSIMGSTAYNNSVHNFFVGNGSATGILVDRNSAFGLSPNPNYYIFPATPGVVITANNAGTP
jgi:hypothetical protein